MLNRSIIWIALLAWSLFGTELLAQPANNNCANADVINIPSGGYALGVFTSNVYSTCGATKEIGEYIPPQQVTAANDDGTMWYRFSIATTRNVRILLKQSGNVLGMAAQDAGWSLYDGSIGGCLPGAAALIDPPVINIEGYTHFCLKPGTYLVQLGAIAAPCDSVFLELTVNHSNAAEILYDYASSPMNFTLASGNNLPAWLNQYYLVNCQSHYQAEPLCPNATYQQTTWHVFNTDNFIDHLRFEVGETPWDNTNLAARTWGYQLYEGDARVDSIADGVTVGGVNLTPVGACQTLTMTNPGTYATTWHNCELDPNKTYTIKLYHPRNYGERINVRLYEAGIGQTTGPDPQSLPAAHRIGVLPYGTPVSRNNVWACNALMSRQPGCLPVLPAGGTYNNGGVYTDLSLNTWYTFEVPGDADVTINLNTPWAPAVYARLYRGDINDVGCGGLVLDRQWYGNLVSPCLAAGKYSLQLLGINNPPQAHWYDTHLGKSLSMSIQINNLAPQIYGLHTPTNYFQVNGGVALPSSAANVGTAADYFDCRPTPLPAGDVCGGGNDRAIYRVITIGQNGILTVGGGNWWYMQYRLYRGDASAEPIVANRIQNLVDQVGCQSLYWPAKVCVTPGRYTLVTFGDPGDIKQGDNPWVRFEAFPATQYTNPLAPQIVANLSNSNRNIASATTRWDCNNNPETIIAGGTPYAPCAGALKQTYYEFFVEDQMSITFSLSHSQYMTPDGAIQARIFRGRRSTNSITGIFSDCTGGFTQDRCNTSMTPGWYTVVIYGYAGGTFASPTYTSGLGGVIGNTFSWSISGLTPYTPQRWETIPTADDTLKRVTPVVWAPNPGHTNQVPHQGRTYVFQTEYWDCDNNLPLQNGVVACAAPGTYNRHTFHVFTLLKPSYVYIYGLNPWPYNYQTKLYTGDLRTAPVPPPGGEYPITHGCITDQMRMCLQPGDYTLVTFANNSNIGNSHTPVIYVDSLGVSKFDNASNAYDFGSIPTDNVPYYGKIGDPPGPYGRTPSDDFFMCSTWSKVTDPYTEVCYIGQNPPANPLPSPTNPRRNLWYTFVVDGPGTVTVTGQMLTPGKTGTARMEVYLSNDVVFNPGAGQVDSTFAQGLTFVGSTRQSSWWCPNYDYVSFFRDPCTFTTPNRYYVVVTNYDGYEPDAQFRMNIRYAPAPPTYVLYDHYSESNPITAANGTQCAPPYLGDTLSTGTYIGCVGNLTCATKDPTDQNTCGTKTLWYHIDVDRSGEILMNYDRPGGVVTWADADMQLYREVVPGDSSSSGLVRVPMNGVWRNDNPSLAGNNYWGSGCMYPGRYYIMFTGCNYPTETVRPRVWLRERNFDLCDFPASVEINGFGAVNLTNNITCLTIGEGPGEDGTNMGCLNLTGHKSSWMRINVNFSDTVDVNITLSSNNLNIVGDQLRWRVGYGDCNSMNFQECYLQGLYQSANLRCRLQGSVWVQTSMPDNATGDLRFDITTSKANTTTCTPIDPAAPVAAFSYNATCFDEPVYFTNQSTEGADITYEWDFGDGSSHSFEIDPIYQYAVPDTYVVRLVATRTILTPPTILRDTFERSVIVYPKPNTNFTIPDTILAGQPLSAVNTTTNDFAYSFYEWSFCNAPGFCGASITNSTLETPPAVTYSWGGTKTICLRVFNGLCDSMICKDVFVKFEDIWSGGPYDGHAVQRSYPNCEENIYVGGPYDGTEEVEQIADCSVNIWVGGPYDGHAVVRSYQVCTQNIFVGGPYDGTEVVQQIADCAVNIFAGGPYDGHAVVRSYQNCVTNIFTGGPYDGADPETLFSNCTINIFTGGPYDGHDSRSFFSNCTQNIFVGGPYDGTDDEAQVSTCSLNIFTGGPYDGTDVKTDIVACPIVTTMWSGGPYDGHSAVKYTICPTPPNIFAGGPFDGFGIDEVYANCELNLWAGGPYDGHAVARSYANCTYNIFAGGPFDGFGIDEVYANCTVNIWAGGPFDGFGVDEIYATCAPNVFVGGPYDGTDDEAYAPNCAVNIFAGGPYDGHAVVRSYATCTQNVFVGGPYDGTDDEAYVPNCTVNIWAGGPYDGFAFQRRYANCVQNVFVGGPYDGTDNEVIENTCVENIWVGGPFDGFALASVNSFDATGDTICPNQTATLTSQSPSDWYTTYTGGTAVATNTDTYVTPVLTSTRIYYAQSLCCPTCARVPVIAQVNDTLDPSFSFIAQCTGINSTFTNTTIVSGAPVASLGGDLFGLGTTGLPPAPGQISFSTARDGTPVFARLNNNVHDDWSAWRGNNTGSRTQWAQWNYVTPRSVRRFFYWNAYSTAYQNSSPKLLKLYYSNGGPWIMVKAWIPTYPSTGTFDTGIIPETNGLFANRWMLEFDVIADNGPNLGEFQIFASTPTVNSAGLTTTWDFGDGATASGSPATYNFPNGAGTYPVTMTVSAPGLCPASITQNVNICSNNALPIAYNELTASLDAQKTGADLAWTVEGTWNIASFQKLDRSGQWVTLQTVGYAGHSVYYSKDPFLYYGDKNYYRVQYTDVDGAVGYSNIAEVTVDRPVADAVLIYPNPVTRSTDVTYDLISVKSGFVDITIHDMQGKLVYKNTKVPVEVGRTKIVINTSLLAKGMYATTIRMPGGEYSRRLLVLDEEQ